MKITKEKRNQIVLGLICAVAVVALMWFYLIRPQYAALSEIGVTQKDASSKLAGIQKKIKDAKTIKTELEAETQTLSNAEDDMASGDLYSWTYNTIRNFKTPYHVDIPDIGHPDVGTMDLLPGFPFKQVRFTVTGKAYYHDLGKFIADFENKFPHIRVVNLEVQRADPSGAGEMLSFKMDIIVLVKSSTT